MEFLRPGGSLFLDLSVGYKVFTLVKNSSNHSFMFYAHLLYECYISVTKFTKNKINQGGGGEQCLSK